MGLLEVYWFCSGTIERNNYRKNSWNFSLVSLDSDQQFFKLWESCEIYARKNRKVEMFHFECDGRTHIHCSFFICYVCLCDFFLFIGSTPFIGFTTILRIGIHFWNSVSQTTTCWSIFELVRCNSMHSSSKIKLLNFEKYEKSLR